MGYELPQSCRDVILCPPGHEPPHVMQTPRGVVSTGPDSAPARVYGKPIPFPFRKFAPYESVPLPSEMRGQSRRVIIV
jgi:hypothetical protein